METVFLKNIENDDIGLCFCKSFWLNSSASLPVCFVLLFWLKHVKKIWPPTDRWLKREEYFNSFLREIWIIFGNIPQFSQNIFLKVSCDVKLETSSKRLNNRNHHLSTAF